MSLGRFVEEKNGKLKHLSNSHFVFTDTETGVQYLFVSGSITLLVDENGKPLVNKDLINQSQ